MKTLLHFLRKAALGMLAVSSAVSAHAAMSTPLNIEFSGGVPPASPATPWVSATFENETGGTVLMTLTAPHLTNPEQMESFYFNFNDTLAVQNLSFQLVSAGSFALPTIDLSQNAFKADGDGQYDIRLNFATSGGSGQTFGQGDTLVYRLSYTSAIDASQFGYLSSPSGGHGPFYAAAHIQNTGWGQSGWIGATELVPLAPVPEAPTLLAAASLVGVFLVRLFRRHRGMIAKTI